MPRTTKAKAERKPPPRDREEKRPISPEEVAEYRRRYENLCREYVSKAIVGTKSDLDITVLSATINEDEIHISLVVRGDLTTPTEKATSRAEMVVLKIPAKVERVTHEESFHDRRNEPNEFPLPFPDLG